MSVLRRVYVWRSGGSRWGSVAVRLRPTWRRRSPGSTGDDVVRWLWCALCECGVARSGESLAEVTGAMTGCPDCGRPEVLERLPEWMVSALEGEVAE